MKRQRRARCSFSTTLAWESPEVECAPEHAKMGLASGRGLGERARSAAVAGGILGRRNGVDRREEARVLTTAPRLAASARPHEESHPSGWRRTGPSGTLSRQSLALSESDNRGRPSRAEPTFGLVVATGFRRIDRSAGGPWGIFFHIAVDLHCRPSRESGAARRCQCSITARPAPRFMRQPSIEATVSAVWWPLLVRGPRVKRRVQGLSLLGHVGVAAGRVRG